MTLPEVLRIFAEVKADAERVDGSTTWMEEARQRIIKAWDEEMEAEARDLTPTPDFAFEEWERG